MTSFRKALDRILRGTSDAGIDFSELCKVLERLEFQERIRGAHHIFVREGVSEILNLQPRHITPTPAGSPTMSSPLRRFWATGSCRVAETQRRGRNAKPYQVKQVRNVILKYRLGDASEE